MTGQIHVERVLDAFLAPDHDDLPDRVLDAVLGEIARTPQRHAPRMPWRSQTMLTIPRFSAYAIAAIAVIVMGSVLLRGSSDGGAGATPTPGASAVEPSPSTAAIPRAPVPSGWTASVSAHYEFTIAYPPGWTAIPSDHAWTWQHDGGNWLSTAADAFLAPDRSVRVSAWSVPLPTGTTIETWADVERWVVDYCARSGDSPCTGIHQRAVPLCIEMRDCHPALLVPFNDDVIAFGAGGVLGSGMTVVAIWRPETDPSVAPYGGATQLLEEFLATMGVYRADANLGPQTVDAAASFKAAAPSP